MSKRMLEQVPQPPAGRTSAAGSAQPTDRNAVSGRPSSSRPAHRGVRTSIAVAAAGVLVVSLGGGTVGARSGGVPTALGVAVAGTPFAGAQGTGGALSDLDGIAAAGASVGAGAQGARAEGAGLGFGTKPVGQPGRSMLPAPLGGPAPFSTGSDGPENPNDESAEPGPSRIMSPPAANRSRAIPLASGVGPAVRTVLVDRVPVTTAVRSVLVPQPAGRTIPTATLTKGSSKVVQQGRPGRFLVSYRVTTVNGKQTLNTETGRRTVAAALPTLTEIGTRPVAPVAPNTFTRNGSEVFTNDTTFGVNWDGLAMCESTHNPRAINANPSAGLPTYGMFQFDLPTWESVGGSGNPIDATVEEQLMRAKLLYQQRGLDPWACAYAAH